MASKNKATPPPMHCVVGNTEDSLATQLSKCQCQHNDIWTAVTVAAGPSSWPVVLKMLE